MGSGNNPEKGFGSFAKENRTQQQLRGKMGNLARRKDSKEKTRNWLVTRGLPFGSTKKQQQNREKAKGWATRYGDDRKRMQPAS